MEVIMLRQIIPWVVCLTLVPALLTACAGPADTPEPTSSKPTAQPSLVEKPAVVEPSLGSTEPSPDSTVPSPSTPLPDDSLVTDWLPKPDDEILHRGNAFVQKSDLLTLESFPPQFVLMLEGTLPTPCNQLRVRVPAPDTENRIHVEVYSVSNPDQMCIQILAPFTARVPLEGLGSGKYTVSVNGQEVGSIEVP
jgi:hypothetical protein